MAEPADSARVKVLTDFEAAAAEKVRVSADGREVHFAAPLDASPRGMWFHFKAARPASAEDETPITFVLTNREQMLGAYSYDHVVPVFRRGDGPWQRVDPANCLCEDRTPPARPAVHAFRFQVPCGPGLTEIAYCHPYTADMIDALLARVAKVRGAAVETIGKSAGGRPLRVVRIGAPAKGRRAVWVLARQHAGEVSGSFAAEGLIDAAVGRDKWAAALRRRATLYVCPAVDIDGVAEGLYGKDRAPVDFNRDWSANPKRREIAALRRAMDASAGRAGGPLLAVIDLHAPGPGDVSFPVPPHPAWAGRDAWQRAWWLAKLVERHCPDSAPVRWANTPARHIDWSPPETGPKMASNFHATCGLADFAATIELTYHWQANSKLIEPDDWRRMGKAVGQALAELARGGKPPRSVTLPDPPGYLGENWGWLNTPQLCNAKIADAAISLQADGPQAVAALLARDPIPIGRGRFAAAASLYRTSHAKCQATRVIFFFHKGVFTGEMSEQRGELAGQNELTWRGPARRAKPADAARVAVILRNWFGTVTLGPPGRSE